MYTGCGNVTAPEHKHCKTEECVSNSVQESKRQSNTVLTYVTNLYRFELGYNVMKATEYFVSL
jgi:hypothetical protein